MDGDLDGKASQGAAGEGGSGEQVLAQGDQDAQADGAKEVAGGGADDDVAYYQAALRAQDAEIETLQTSVVEVVKTSEATKALNKEIAALKKQMADERVEFALRSVKAAKALLEEHDGDVAALVAAEPWLFDGVEAGTSQRTSQDSVGGAMGLEPVGVAGGSDERDLRRWERIAGLTEEEA